MKRHKRLSVLILAIVSLVVSAAGQTVVGTNGPPANQNIPHVNPRTAVTLSPGSVGIFPGSATSVSNCIPFGNNTTFGFTGFIYRSIPAFSLPAGGTFAFDLGALNDLDVRRNIYFAVANKNPDGTTCGSDVGSQGVAALAWTKVASDTQIPLNPKGDTISGNYELTYTAETSFSFPGGGFIVGVGSSPPGAFADFTCDQVLVRTSCSDVSGNFYSRFFFKSDQTLGLLDDIGGGGSGVEIGGILIGAGAGAAACPAHAHGHLSTGSPGHFGGISSPHAHHAQHGTHLLANTCPPHAPGHKASFGLTPDPGDGLLTGNAAAANPDFVGALNQDGTVNGDPSAPGAAARAARRGTVVQFFGSAAGLFLGDEDHRSVQVAADLFTPPASGEPLYYTTRLPEVRIGGVAANALFSGLAPGLKGVWQINVLVPENAPTGRVPVAISYEGDELRSVDITVE